MPQPFPKNAQFLANMYQRKSTLQSAAAMLLVMSSVSVSSAQSTVSYRLLTNGVESTCCLTPGTYQIDVQVQVTSNDLGSLNSTLVGGQGGLLQNDFNFGDRCGISRRPHPRAKLSGAVAFGAAPAAQQKKQFAARAAGLI